MKLFLGIDVGTSGIKVIIIDEKGKIHGSGYQEYNVIMPYTGWAEQDPIEWWAACCRAIAQAAEMCGRAKDIVSIGFSGQMQGLTVLGKDMKPLDRCILWLDQRAQEEVADIEQLLPDNEALDITANHCLNSFWAPKLIWLRKHRPDVYSDIHKVLFPKDFLRYMLTGEVALEVTDASLSFFLNVEKRRLSTEILERLSIPGHILPHTLVESQDVAGELKRELAEQWGMRPGIPVVAGAGDQQAGAVGTGITEAGIVGATIGTSGVVFVCTDQPVVDRRYRALNTMCHAIPEKWCFLGLSLTAGGSFKWLRDRIFEDKKDLLAVQGKDVYDYMTGLAARANPGCEGLTFLPYLNGEKTPVSDSDARALFFGLSYRHGLQEICRSVMEGVGFALRQTVDICREFNIPFREVRANGGGAKSPLWRQILADIFDVSILTMNVEEGPAAGAAILGAVGAGAFSNVQEACGELISVAGITEPISKNADVYNEYYETYKALYPSLKELYQKQARIVQQTL